MFSNFENTFCFYLFLWLNNLSYLIKFIHMFLDYLIYFLSSRINVIFTMFHQLWSRVLKCLVNAFGIISTFLWRHCIDACCLLCIIIVNFLSSTQMVYERLSGRITLHLFFLLQYPSSIVYSFKTLKSNDWKSHACRSFIVTFFCWHDSAVSLSLMWLHDIYGYLFQYLDVWFFIT